MANYSLQFDGSQNYLNVGTLGNLGQNLASGFYCEFYIKTSTTSDKQIFGTQDNATGQTINLEINASATSGRLLFQLIDKSDPLLKNLTGTCDTTINDGTTHLFKLTVTPASNTIVITIDGVGQTISYDAQGTPNTFENFTKNFVFAAQNNDGTVGQFSAITLDDIKIGVSSASLYGTWNLNEGSGTSAADSSGAGATGTLVGTPKPTWATGIGIIGAGGVVVPGGIQSAKAVQSLQRL